MSRDTTSGDVLGIIVARGGSKGLPRKNVLPLGGRPLINWTVDAALRSNCIERVVVSTDDDEIAKVAQQAGAEIPFMRPADLSTDHAKAVDVVQHTLEHVSGYRSAVLLQPTSPLRTAEDIDASYALWRASGAPSCVSVCASSESPWLMYQADACGRLKRLLPTPKAGLRRQDLPKTLILNGAIYFFESSRFLADKKFIYEDSYGYEMPVDRSIDIDTMTDLASAERQIKTEKQREIHNTKRPFR